MLNTALFKVEEVFWYEICECHKLVVFISTRFLYGINSGVRF